VALIGGILARREAEGRKTRDLLSVLARLRNPDGQPRYSVDQITGMVISMMFAGHHTSSGTAAWTLIELLRHPAHLARVVEELEKLYADGRDVSYQALREIPELEGAIKEALRLHPPLILLLRKVQSDFEYAGTVVRAGRIVGVSPAVSNRLPECFPEPERFDPERYGPGREEDRRHPYGWIPFGGGRHRCVGAAFAMMQLKAIFSILLRRFEFEMAQPSHTYHNDHSKMVVQLAQPCRVRYRRRAAAPAAGTTRSDASAAPARSGGLRVRVDLDLCQGHGVCASEAPEVFALDAKEVKVRLLDERPAPALRARVEAAERHCPTRAISIVED
jgi:sterol 14-demethylase